MGSATATQRRTEAWISSRDYTYQTASPLPPLVMVSLAKETEKSTFYFLFLVSMRLGDDPTERSRCAHGLIVKLL